MDINIMDTVEHLSYNAGYDIGFQKALMKSIHKPSKLNGGWAGES